MTLSLAKIAIVLGFILCIGAALVLALKSNTERPDA